MKQKLPIGILGCGAISQIAHIPAALRAQNVQLAALCDRDELLLHRVADKANVAARYNDYHQMLASPEIAAVVLAIPDSLHVPLAIQALRAGKHVLVEKPLGSASDQCHELVHLVESSNLKLQVGCMKRHDLGIRFAREHVKSKLGKILSFSAVFQDTVFRSAMQATCLDPLVASGRQNPSDDDWKADRCHYNLFTQGAHLFDMLLYLTGPITSVHAIQAELHGNFSWHGILTSAAGAAGHFELTCKTSGDWCERYHVAGEGGNVEIDVGLWFYHRPAKVRAFAGDQQTWTQPLTGYSNMFANQLDSFAECIELDRPTTPNVRDGLAVVEILEAIETSIRLGQQVEVGKGG